MTDDVIARSRPLKLWFPFGFILSMSAFIGMLLDPSRFLEFLSFGAVAAAVSTIVYRWWWRWWWWARNALTAIDEGLVAHIRGHEELAYRWDRIEKLGWEPGTWGFIGGIPFGSRVLIYPTGGPYDLPGPNHPVRIGAVQPPLPWRRGEIAARVSAHLDELLRPRRRDAETDPR